MDVIGRDELVTELNTLLEAERAGARVGASLEREAGDGFEPLAKLIHADEIKWARALFEALHALGAEPSDRVGEFYERAMAIPEFRDRLAFTNRGQGWVARKLRGLIPRLDDGPLRETLQEMLDAHVVNIDAANEALEHAPPAAGDRV
jgi:nitronate monooxygenase